MKKINRTNFPQKLEDEENKRRGETRETNIHAYKQELHSFCFIFLLGIVATTVFFFATNTVTSFAFSNSGYHVFCFFPFFFSKKKGGGYFIIQRN